MQLRRLQHSSPARLLARLVMAVAILFLFIPTKSLAGMAYVNPSSPTGYSTDGGAPWGNTGRQGAAQAAGDNANAGADHAANEAKKHNDNAKKHEEEEKKASEQGDTATAEEEKKKKEEEQAKALKQANQAKQMKDTAAKEAKAADAAKSKPDGSPTKKIGDLEFKQNPDGTMTPANQHTADYVSQNRVSAMDGQKISQGSPQSSGTQGTRGAQSAGDAGASSGNGAGNSGAPAGDATSGSQSGNQASSSPSSGGDTGSGSSANSGQPSSGGEQASGGSGQPSSSGEAASGQPSDVVSQGQMEQAANSSGQSKPFSEMTNDQRMTDANARYDSMFENNGQGSSSAPTSTDMPPGFGATETSGTHYSSNVQPPMSDFAASQAAQGWNSMGSKAPGVTPAEMAKTYFNPDGSRIANPMVDGKYPTPAVKPGVTQAQFEAGYTRWMGQTMSSPADSAAIQAATIKNSAGNAAESVQSWLGF